jgi:hypothetical protein
MSARPLTAVERLMRAQGALRLGAANTPTPPLRIVNRACVAGGSGHCLACGAPQGEPCRQPSIAARR